MTLPPILAHKTYSEESIFTAANLLREARRQKSLAATSVPAMCILDPDGDIVRWLTAAGRAHLDPHWACYHTTMYTFVHDDIAFGIIGCAVGASFAVLVAEELFAAGCQLLMSITSAGQIEPLGDPPYFVLIDRAVRDEGTSYHYAPPDTFSQLHPNLRQMLDPLFDQTPFAMFTGTTWTTDAPFRETASAIAAYRDRGVFAVEMEAAALYAFAATQQRAVICFAHVTNQMAQNTGDFEKGSANGSQDALEVVRLVAHAWLDRGAT